MRCKRNQVIHAGLIAGMLFSSSVATAAEKNLEFQLVVKLINPQMMEAPVKIYEI